MAVCQNLVPLVNIKIAGKWMFIPPKMVLIGIDPYPHQKPLVWNLERMTIGETSYCISGRETKFCHRVMQYRIL